MRKEITFERVKVDIVSTLMPFKDGATEAELWKEYLSLLGHQIPFKEVGFQTLRGLLGALPLAYAGGRWRAIPEESTAHLSRMISAQKSKTRSRSKRKSAPQAFYGLTQTPTKPSQVVEIRLSGCSL